MNGAHCHGYTASGWPVFAGSSRSLRFSAWAHRQPTIDSVSRCRFPAAKSAMRGASAADTLRAGLERKLTGSRNFLGKAASTFCDSSSCSRSRASGMPPPAPRRDRVGTEFLTKEAENLQTRIQLREPKISQLRLNGGLLVLSNTVVEQTARGYALPLAISWWLDCSQDRRCRYA